jgi:hypothetical protein
MSEIQEPVARLGVDAILVAGLAVLLFLKVFF